MGGMPKGLSADKLQLALTALDLHDTGKYSIAEIANRLQMPVARLVEVVFVSLVDYS